MRSKRVKVERAGINLKVEGSSRTASLGFPLKIVSSYGATYGFATCEADAQRQLANLRKCLEQHPHYNFPR